MGSITGGNASWGAFAGLSHVVSGVFSSTRRGFGSTLNTNDSYDIFFDSSLSVPTGTQNAVENLSLQYWIRTS